MDTDAVKVMLELSELDYILVDNILYLKSLQLLPEAFNSNNYQKENGELFCKYIQNLSDESIYYIRAVSLLKRAEPIYHLGSSAIQYNATRDFTLRLELQNIKTMFMRTIELTLI